MVVVAKPQKGRLKTQKIQTKKNSGNFVTLVSQLRPHLIETMGASMRGGGVHSKPWYFGILVFFLGFRRWLFGRPASYHSLSTQHNFCLLCLFAILQFLVLNGLGVLTQGSHTSSDTYLRECVKMAQKQANLRSAKRRKA